MKPIRSLLPIYALALAVAIAQATVVVEMGLDEMIKEAELIVEGTVVDVQSRYSGDQRTIYTYVTLTDLRVVHGQSDGSTLTLRLEGGQVGDQRITVVGMPSFVRGEREFLFIRGNGRAISPAVGFFQGRFRVINGQIHDDAGNPIVEIRDGAFVKVVNQPRTQSGSGQGPPGGVVSPGAPSKEIFLYREGAGDRKKNEAPEPIEKLPPIAPAPTLPLPVPTQGPTAASPPPVSVDPAMVVPRRKPASIFLDRTEDPGRRLSVEEFIREIRTGLKR